MIKRVLILYACCLIATLFVDESASAQEPPIELDGTIQHFKVAGNGDALLLPVQYDDHEYLFLVDTGASLTCFDRSLLRTRPKDRIVIESLVEKTFLDIYETPRATVGKFALRETVSVVGGYDFDKFRKVSGLAIHGVIGLDFLVRHVIHIDFDRGLFCFLKRADPRTGKAIELVNEANGQPAFYLDFPRAGKNRFELDTGLISQDSGELTGALCQSLIKDGNFRDVGNSLVESVSGTSRQVLVQGAELVLGGVAVKNPIMSQGRSNLIGLGFFSRFNVTLDFSNKKMYLAANKSIHRHDAKDRSGLRLLRNRATTEVAAVERGSPSDKMGLRVGDAIVRVQDRETAKMSLFDVRRQFCDEGKSLRVIAVRDGKELDLMLRLR